ncbi:Rha-like transcriptional regulator [Corynebacterium phage Juicebox]|uniref:Antirepressor n=1 Tax=Corynebacterium phage Juicebox TaxID=2301600 RepID=A0A385UEX2_9CAUD|nr:Rha-like transcriptional regulator [Corynebacterium phage Juicebox]AYB69465.1 antirepressor [Corynebacterium phage Juicebox]
MMNELVHTNADGTPTTTTEIIAAGTGLQHASVIKLIRHNIADFEEFGLVGFEIRARAKGQHGGGDTEYAVLNREHAMFAMTMFRNNAVVIEFKKALIRAFTEMEKRLAVPVIDGASITRMELIQIAMNAETERLQLEAKNKELEPKAEAYDSFLDATGKYSVGNVGKMLGIGQNKLFRELRNRGVFIAAGSKRNTPYQKYMHHFEVIPREFEKRNGDLGCSYTTYVQPSGIDFIRKKLGLERIDPVLPETAGAGEVA